MLQAGHKEPANPTDYDIPAADPTKLRSIAEQIALGDSGSGLVIAYIVILIGKDEFKARIERASNVPCLDSDYAIEKSPGPTSPGERVFYSQLLGAHLQRRRRWTDFHH